MKFRIQTLAASALMAVVAESSSLGAHLFFNGVTGSWFTATNWTPNGVPGASDTAYIYNASTAQIGMGGAGSAAALEFGEDGNLSISAGGSLAVSGALTGSSTVGPARSGSVSIDGSGSSLSANSAVFRTGNDEGANGGNLTLTVANGASFAVNGGSGTLTLYRYFGASGTITINVGNGGTAGSLNLAAINQVESPQFAALNFNYTDSATHSFSIQNRISLTKSGSGTTTLSSNGNSFTGGSTISGGSLLVTNSSGSGLGTGAVTVQNGGTLGGTGIIALGGSNAITLQNGASVAAGTSGIGTLTLSGASTTGAILSAGAGSTFSLDLGASNTSDKIDFWNYAGASDFLRNNNVLNFTGAQAGTFTLFRFYSNSGTTPTASGISSGLVLGSGLDGFNATLNYNTNDISLTLSAVPEPHWLAFLGMAFVFLFYRRNVS